MHKYIETIIKKYLSRRVAAVLIGKPACPTRASSRWTNCGSQPRCRSSSTRSLLIRWKRWTCNRLLVRARWLPPPLLTLLILWTACCFCGSFCWVMKVVLKLVDHFDDVLVKFSAVLGLHLFAGLWGLPLCELQEESHHFGEIWEGSCGFEEKCEGGRFELSHFFSAILEAKVLIESPQCPTDSRVEMILDWIVSSAGQHMRNVFPSISKLRMRSKEHSLLLSAPRGTCDTWRELIVPSD